MQIKILSWQRRPYEADEEPGMPTYRLAFTANHRLVVADLSVEIDGREMEYTPVAGALYNPDTDPDFLDALLVAMSEDTSLEAEMNAEAERYYAK